MQCTSCWLQGERLIHNLHETIVGVNRFNVECEEFSFPTSDNKGEGGVSTKDIPEDVAKEGKDSGENIKAEKKEENANHTILVLVQDPFLGPKVRCVVSSTIFSWPMEPSLLPHLVQVLEWMVLFYWYTLSPALYPEGDVDQVVNELVW